MNIISAITLDEIRTHEVTMNTSLRLGEHQMNDFFPVEQISMYRVVFNSDDLYRLFLLWDFSPATLNRSCRLVDILPDRALTLAMERMPANSENQIDLSTSIGMEPVFVSNNLNTGTLTAIDGNHRLLAHFIRHNSVEGVTALVAQHPKMCAWPYIPYPART